MQRVSLQRFAGVFPGCMSESPRACQVDGERAEKHEDRRHARLDMHAVEKQPVERLINDVKGGQREQTGFHEGGKILELSVTVRVALVGRLIRHSN